MSAALRVVSPLRPARPVLPCLAALPLVALIALLGACATSSTQRDGGSAGASSTPRRADADSVNPAEDAWSRGVWQRLDQTENTCPEVFDYHPDGGMLVTWCHLLSLIGWDDLLQRAPQPIFLKGPHRAQDLDLSNAASFGHYNPEFVRWLGDHLIPGASDPAFAAATRPLYAAALQPLARISWQTRAKLASDPGCRDRELALYKRAIAAAESFWYERWFFFMNDAFCTFEGDSDWFFDHGFDGGVSGNVVKSTVGFWLRRHVDGTDALFERALRRLLEAYDSEWLAAHTPG